MEEIISSAEVPQNVVNVTIENSEPDESLADGDSLVFQFPDSFTTTNVASVFGDSADSGFLQTMSYSNEDTVGYSGEDTAESASYSSTVPSTPYTPSSPVFLSSAQQSPSSASTGNVPSFVKASLKNVIRQKRISEGKDDLKVEFTPPPPEMVSSVSRQINSRFSMILTY